MAKRKSSSRHGHSGDPRKRAAEEQSRIAGRSHPGAGGRGRGRVGGRPPDRHRDAGQLADRRSRPGRPDARRRGDRSATAAGRVRPDVPRLRGPAAARTGLDRGPPPAGRPSARRSGGGSGSWRGAAVAAAAGRRRRGGRLADHRPVAGLDRHRRLAAGRRVRPHGDRPGRLQLRRRAEGRLRRPGAVDRGPGGVECERRDGHGDLGSRPRRRADLAHRRDRGRSCHRAAVRVRQLAAGSSAGGVGVAAVPARGPGLGASGVDPGGHREGGRRVRRVAGGCGGRRPVGSGGARRRSPRPRPRHVRGPRCCSVPYGSSWGSATCGRPPCTTTSIACSGCRTCWCPTSVGPTAGAGSRPTTPSRPWPRSPTSGRRTCAMWPRSTQDGDGHT